MDRADRTELFAAFWADDADGLTRFLCGQLKDTISFFDACETYYHAFIAGLFTFSGWKVISNYEHGWGRPDIVVRDNKNSRAAAIEVKYAKTEKELLQFVDKAISQGRDADYTLPLRKKYQKVSLWGMAFYRKTCLLRVADISVKPSRRSSLRSSTQPGQPAEQSTNQPAEQTAKRTTKRTSAQTARKGSKQTGKQSAQQSDKSSS